MGCLGRWGWGWGGGRVLGFECGVCAEFEIGLIPLFFSFGFFFDGLFCEGVLGVSFFPVF